MPEKKNHNCGEPLFEIFPEENHRRFQCPKCGRILKYKEQGLVTTEWCNGSDFRADLDQFLIDEGNKILSAPPPLPLKGTRYLNAEDGCIYEFDGNRTWIRATKNLERELNESEKSKAVEKTC